jgi:hypothetical protein
MWKTVRLVDKQGEGCAAGRERHCWVGEVDDCCCAAIVGKEAES